jgi:hypothetical protein
MRNSKSKEKGGRIIFFFPILLFSLLCLQLLLVSLSCLPSTLGPPSSVSSIMCPQALLMDSVFSPIHSVEIGPLGLLFPYLLTSLYHPLATHIHYIYHLSVLVKWPFQGLRYFHPSPYNDRLALDSCTGWPAPCKLNSVVCSPQENYTDRAAAAS